MSVSARARKEEDIEKIKRYRDMMEKDGLEVRYSNDPYAFSPPSGREIDILTNLPDHLKRTALTLEKLSRATAEEVAAQTKRARAVESAYLNQLVIMGYFKKERIGRKTFFYVE